MGSLKYTGKPVYAYANKQVVSNRCHTIGKHAKLDVNRTASAHFGNITSNSFESFVILC